MLANSYKKFLPGIIILLCVASAHMAFSRWMNTPVHPPNYFGKLESLSFSPVGRYESAETGLHPSIEQITNDMAVVAKITKKIRTYTVDGTMETVPSIARGYGLKVSLGVWVDDHTPERTEREMTIAAREALKYPDTVQEIIIGSEAILRTDSTPEHIVALIDDMKKRTGGKVKVTTSDVWPIWIENPILAEHADFIAAHILPYWDRRSPEQAVDTTIEFYEQLHKKYPDKEIMISEFGWPSGILENGDATTSRASQAMVIREFLTRVKGIHYNIIEAFDQPWKINEGNSGAYWGIFNADRQQKFPLYGVLENDISWHERTVFSIVFGILIALPFCFPIGIGRRNTVMGIIVTAFLSQCVGEMLGNIVIEPFIRYCSLGLLVSWAIGAPLVLLLVIQSFERIRETVYMITGKKIRGNSVAYSENSYPLVSIHVPACREQPDVLLRTLRSISDLGWPNLEVLCLVNNTKDSSLTEPVKNMIENHPAYSRVKYIDLGTCSGFKAGALNKGLVLTSPETEYIAVVDADYVVERDWLQKTMGTFSDKRVAIVQSPQEHYASTVLEHAMNSEYAGFFDGGMVERNEDNAIITHGTMLLVRRSAIIEAGGWDENFICEDTELGLRLFRAGWSAAYTRERSGRGVLPDTLQGFRKQRDRWAYGATRIALHHFKALLPWNSELSGQQKYHFAMGWLHWAGDAVAILLAVSNLLWALWIIGSGKGEPPPVSLSIATLSAAFIAVMHTMILHTLRVKRGFLHALLASITGTSLQMTVGVAVIRGLLHGCTPFNITPKGGKKGDRGIMTRLNSLNKELVLGTLLPVAAGIIYWNNTGAPLAWKIYCVMLCVLAVPHLLAVIMDVTEYFLMQKKTAVFNSVAELKTAGAD